MTPISAAARGTERVTAAEFRARPAEKPRKYRNKPVVIDGIRFDSTVEGNYYLALRDRERKGEVGGVELQRPFPLLVASGIVVGSYRADFAFWDHKEDRFRVIDVKGFDTPLSKWKRKHVKAQYGFEVEIVK